MLRIVLTYICLLALSGCGSNCNAAPREPLILKDISETVYVVKEKVDLLGETLILPPDCILRFEGGFFENGSIIFDNTLIEGNYRFNCSCSGTIANDIVCPQMYGAKGDGISDDSEPIQKAINSSKQVLFKRATYLLKSPIIFDGQNYLVDFNLSTLKKENNTGFNYKYKDTDYRDYPSVIIIKPHESNTSGHIYLKNLIITSNHTNDGIHAEWCRNVILDNVRIFKTNCGFVCGGFTNTFRDITIWDSKKGFQILKGNAILFERCFSTGCGWEILNSTGITLNTCSADDNNPCYCFRNSNATLNGCTFESMGVGIYADNSIVEMTGDYELHIYDSTKCLTFVEAINNSVIDCNSSVFHLNNYLNKKIPKTLFFISRNASIINMEEVKRNKVYLKIETSDEGHVLFGGKQL